MIQLWKCPCGQVNFSIPERHHELDYCTKCKEHYVDLETYGCRATVGVTFIRKLNYSFFLELIKCMDEQGFEPYVKLDKLYLNLTAVMKAREIEDEILKQLIDDKYNNSYS
jgi:hypothetical protein